MRPLLIALTLLHVAAVSGCPGGESAPPPSTTGAKAAPVEPQLEANSLPPAPVVLAATPERDVVLWHAYRGALAFARRLDLPLPARRPSPCETCADKPCLDACPVGAFTRAGYDVAACVGHIAGPAGARCMDGGCLARRACPVGRDHAYAPAQARFHMARFLASRRRAG